MTQKQKVKFEKEIAESDARIAQAVETLCAHERGRKALEDLCNFARGVASGLDVSGMDAIETLIEEWAAGRRTFLHQVKEHEFHPILRFDGTPSKRCQDCSRLEEDHNRA